MNARPRAQRGFTLIEAGMVLAVLASAALLYWLWTSSVDKTKAAESLVKLQAQQMAQLTRAMVDYGTANKASWTPGTYYEVYMNQLIAGNHLPTGFGTNGQVGVSPFGQAYRVKGMRTAANPDTIQVITTEWGTPLVGALKRAGYANTPASIKALKQQISAAIARDSGMVSGVMDPSTSVVQGNFAGFTFNINSWFAETMPASARVAVIKNVPPVDTSATTGIGNPAGRWASCNASQIATNATQDAQCVAPYQEIASWPNCGYFRGVVDPIKPTDVGTITFSRSSYSTPAYRTDCFDNFGNSTGVCNSAEMQLAQQRAEDTFESETININNAGFGETLCRRTWWSIVSGNPRQSVWNAPTYNNKLCCVPR